MKEYPTIPGSSKAPMLPCVAFYKYDGSNLRFEWSKKQGWHKFGTRRRLFDLSDPVFGSAIDIFFNNFAEDLDQIISVNYKSAQKLTAYCEFFGEKSFAGNHLDDDPKQLVLIDVNIHKKGFVSPKEFISVFCKNMPERSAQVIYEGNLNKQFIEDVQNGKYPVWEGVVCKGGSGHDMWRCKIKTKAYKEKLQAVFANDWQNFWE